MKRPGACHLDKIEALRRTKLFSNLPIEVLQKLAFHATTRRLSREQMLYSEHETAQGVFVIVEGEVRSVRQTRNGREQVLSTYRPGATLAEVPLFNGGEYFSTAIAEAESIVLYIGHEHVHRICREHPELLWNIARELAHQVRESAELIESLALQNVDQRVAQYLLNVAQDRAVHSGEGVVFELTQTRPEIASRLGSVREVISRSLAHLHQMGLISLDGARLITIPNLEAVQAFCKRNS